MLEVLISVLVLAIGLLGLAGLLVQGVKFNHDAYLRSQVSSLAYEITDRIRLNRANAAAYVGDYDVPAAPGENDCDYTAAPSADNDLGCWRNQVDRVLPRNSSADIADAGGGQYTVTLTWISRETDAAGDPIPTTISYTFQP